MKGDVFGVVVVALVIRVAEDVLRRRGRRGTVNRLCYLHKMDTRKQGVEEVSIYIY